MIVIRLTFILSCEMNRITSSRRAVVSSVADPYGDVKRKQRAPLTRISNNQRVRDPVADQILKPTPSQPVVSLELLPFTTFRHREIPIGDQTDPQDVMEFEHIIYRSLRTKEMSGAVSGFSRQTLLFGTAAFSLMRSIGSITNWG